MNEPTPSTGQSETSPLAAQPPLPAAPPQGSAYREITLSKWDDFIDFAELHAAYLDTLIWRGHGDSNWLLESSLHRQAPWMTDKPAVMAIHLNGFKRSALGRVRDLQFNDPENRWWAVGRHAGLATPLLDWTMSPYVAAFFAFWNREKLPGSAHCAIYSLDWLNVLNARQNQVEQSAQVSDINAYKDCLGLILPYANDNPPMERQSGMFTRLYPPSTCIEQWVRSNFVGHPTTILTKYIIPATAAAPALASLRRMNIHPGTLFPDIHGSAEFCNIWLKDGKYPAWAQLAITSEQFTTAPPEKVVRQPS